MSTIKANTLLHSDGSTTTQPSIPALDKRMAKAWINFNGVSTVVIRDSENVSSLVDNGVGLYTVNFAINLSNTNYVCVGQSANYSSSTTNVFRMSCHSRQVSNFQIANHDTTITGSSMPALDRLSIDVIVMGGQA